ncbi:MAG: cellobiose phosphorylase, partial [Candidatus Omnitrophota bacterium]
MINLTNKMDKELWKFTDNNGTFSSSSAHRINTLYFPLCNQSPIMSSLTPLLGGDLKTDFNSFLLQPVSRRDLHNIKSSRNFWIYLNPEKVWSATGVSKDSVFSKKDKFLLEAGLLWHKVTRENKQIGLKSEILSFIPSTDDPVEIMLINITNISSRVIKFIPTAAIPIFARSAHNLHDHSHVTSLLERVNLEKSGVVVMPTLIFDESGHRKNKTFYFVLAKDERYGNPQYIYPTQDEFIGEGGDLETPQAVMRNLRPRKEKNIQGKETMAGFKFKPCLLKPKESTSYIIILGIVKNKARITGIQKKLNSRKKVDIAFAKNKSYWQEISSQLLFNTGDLHFDNWLKWVNIQPQLRKIFGCSFLPDFDYGKGGRGWRDLWQDCLSLILKNPGEVAPSLINNFSGIRIDGSNATIIEDDSNEFIADRNNISRVWMDHGIWPLTTLKLYIHQTGNLNILLKQVPYFRDHQLYRAKLKDESWKPEYGKKLKTKKGKVYKGSILEHLLLQNLVQFFNVGPHNFIRLEDADWNDGLDMAAEFGESVAFSAMYAQNLLILCGLLRRLKQKNILILKEMLILLDGIKNKKINYADLKEKHEILDKYFQATKETVSGIKVFINKTKLINNLWEKANWMSEHIKAKEWLKEGFFNGYYNNDKKRVEGKIKGNLRMTLTGQVFP